MFDYGHKGPASGLCWYIQASAIEVLELGVTTVACG